MIWYEPELKSREDSGVRRLRAVRAPVAVLLNMAARGRRQDGEWRAISFGLALLATGGTAQAQQRAAQHAAALPSLPSHLLSPGVCHESTSSARVIHVLGSISTQLTGHHSSISLVPLSLLFPTLPQLLPPLPLLLRIRALRILPELRWVEP